MASLQAWAYGDMPDGIIIQLQRDVELTMIALSLDSEYLQQRYEYYKQAILEQDQSSEEINRSLGYFESDYTFYKELMQIVQEAGTALPPYQKKASV